MTLPSRPVARLRRAALIVAGLLHLFSIPAMPMLHGWLHAHSHGPGWTAEDHDDGGTPHHHDLGCVVCQAVHAQALPEPSAQPVSGELSLDTPAPSAASLPEAAARARAQARAPPA